MKGFAPAIDTIRFKLCGEVKTNFGFDKFKVCCSSSEILQYLVEKLMGKIFRTDRRE